jgi:hypothetical protein
VPWLVFAVVLYLCLACWTAASDGGWAGFLEPAFLRTALKAGVGASVLLFLLLFVWVAIPCALVAVVAWLILRVLPSSIRDTSGRRWLLGGFAAPDSDAPDVPRSSRRAWRWLVLIPAGIALAILGSGVVGLEYARRRVELRLDAAAAEASREDPFWRYDRVVEDREDVPVDENSAWVVQDVAAALPASWFVVVGSDSMDAPAHEADVFAALNRVLETSNEVALDDDVVALLRTKLAEVEEAVGEGRTLADFDRGRHELVSLIGSDDSEPPESESARATAHLLFADSVLLAHDRRLAEALDSCRAILGAARSIGDEPTPNAQHLRLSIDDWAAHAARRIVGQGEPPDDALARLQRLLLDESDQPLAAYSFRGSRASLDRAIRRLRDKVTRLPDYMTGSSFTAVYSEDVRAPWASVVLDHQRALALEWMNELLAICRLDAPERADRLAALKAQIDEAGATRGGGPFARLMEDGTVLPRVYIPPHLGELDGFTRIRSKLKGTALLIAFERHRRKHGDWPASIEALDPEIMPEPPADPFSGRAFLLDRRAGSVVIYSIGPNLKDEHGAFDPKSRANRPDDFPAQGWDPPLRHRPAPVAP